MIKKNKLSSKYLTLTVLDLQQQQQSLFVLILASIKKSYKIERN